MLPIGGSALVVVAISLGVRNHEFSPYASSAAIAAGDPTYEHISNSRNVRRVHFHLLTI